jgi:hypothetical protein
MGAVSVGQDPSATAEQARRRMHEEIERVRAGVDQMLGEREHGDDRRLNVLEERLLRMEGRIDQVEQERRHAEWRVFSNIERLLDDLLREMRSIADRLSR